MTTADLLLGATVVAAMGAAAGGLSAFLLMRRKVRTERLAQARLGRPTRNRHGGLATQLKKSPRAMVAASTVAAAVATLAAVPPVYDALRELTNTGTDDTRVAGFVGGCEPFVVYAQGRWQPYGASKRSRPDPASPKLGAYDPNKVIAVDGWVHGEPAYPTNSPPFNSDIWYHLADDSGWVTYAGVRAVPTAPDPSGLGEGGQAAPTPAECQGAVSADR